MKIETQRIKRIGKIMDLLKKHVDTVIVLTGILGSILWMNGKFNDIDRRLVRIETVLSVRGLMTGSVAVNETVK